MIWAWLHTPESKHSEARDGKIAMSSRPAWTTQDPVSQGYITTLKGVIVIKT